MIGWLSEMLGKRAVMIRPFMSSCTFVAPSGPVSVRTTWESRASKLSLSLPDAKASLRSTVATRFATFTLSRRVPAAGTCEILVHAQLASVPRRALASHRGNCCRDAARSQAARRAGSRRKHEWKHPLRTPLRHRRGERRMQAARRARREMQFSDTWCSSLSTGSPHRHAEHARVPDAEGTWREHTPRAHASTRGHSLSVDPSGLRDFRGRGDPRLPLLPSPDLHGKEGVDGSSPSEGLSPFLSGDLDSAHGGVP